MSMPATIPRWTKELVQSLPSDGKRYELVAGELLVTPAPAAWHQTVHWRLTIALADYLRQLGLIETIRNAAADISWTDDDLVQPDIFVVVPEDLSMDWATFRRFRLVAEVWHPGDVEPQVVADVLAWRVTPEAPELRIALEEIFRQVG
jgi:Uma2 family endonuclease